MKVWVDGSTTRVAYKFEADSTVTILPLPASEKFTQNMGEYQAVLAALGAAEKRGYKELTVLSDSQLIVRQITGQYATKDPDLGWLRWEVQGLLPKFERVEFIWIPREENIAGRALG